VRRGGEARWKGCRGTRHYKHTPRPCRPSTMQFARRPRPRLTTPESRQQRPTGPSQMSAKTYLRQKPGPRPRRRTVRALLAPRRPLLFGTSRRDAKGNSAARVVFGASEGPGGRMGCRFRPMVSVGRPSNQILSDPLDHLIIRPVDMRTRRGQGCDWRRAGSGPPLDRFAPQRDRRVPWSSVR
jgi:hypothetical protein